MKRTVCIASGVVALFIVFIFLIYAVALPKSGTLEEGQLGEQVQQETPESEDGEQDLNDHYRRRDGKIFFQGNEVLGADAQTFTVLGGRCARDAFRGYVDDSAVPESDPKTFTCLRGGYAKDAARVFYYEKMIANADLASFEVIMGDDKFSQQGVALFAKDKHRIYDKHVAIEGVDVESFSVVGSVTYYLYTDLLLTKDAHHVYADDFSIVPELDPATITIPNQGVPYVKDKARVLYVDVTGKFLPVIGADSTSFVINLEGNHFHASDNMYLYKSDQRIGYTDRRLELIGGYYAKGKDGSIYYKLKKAPIVDPATFTFLGFFSMEQDTEVDGYAKDDKAVYVGGKKLEGADAATFRLTDRVGYAEDKNNKYAFGEKVRNDFVFCSVDPKLLPAVGNLKEIAGYDRDGEKFEFCQTKNGEILIGESADSSDETGSLSKNYYLFDAFGKYLNEKPAVLTCEEYAFTFQRSIDRLEGSVVRLHCGETGGCDVRRIYELDLEKMKTDPEHALSESQEYYDCGYRG